MDIIKITKGIVKVSVMIGSGSIVGNVIRATTPTDASKFELITNTIAGFFIGGMVTEATLKDVDRFFDDISAARDRIKALREPEDVKEDNNIVDGEVVEDQN